MDGIARCASMVRGPGPTQPHRRCEAGREGRFGGRGIAAGAAALRIHTHTHGRVGGPPKIGVSNGKSRSAQSIVAVHHAPCTKSAACSRESL